MFVLTKFYSYEQKKYSAEQKNLRPNKKIFVRIKNLRPKTFSSCEDCTIFVFLQNLYPNKNLFVRIFGNFIRSEEHSIPNSRTTNIRVRTKSIVCRPWGVIPCSFVRTFGFVFGKDNFVRHSYFLFGIRISRIRTRTFGGGIPCSVRVRYSYSAFAQNAMPDT